jgi:pimeloyl-ACP methyl ester carboxylesterase
MEAVVRSIPVYYEEYGSGIPLLLLHGRPLDHRHIAASMEPLFQHRSGWRRIYPDLPGMGKTPGAEWITNQDDILTVVIEFMQSVAPGQHFVVGGISYGGYLTLGLVYQQSAMIDGVLLVVPKVEPDPAKRELPLFQVSHEDPQFLAALTPEENGLKDIIVAQSLETLEAFRTVFDPAAANADHAFLKKLVDGDAFTISVLELAQPFLGPTLMLMGRQDSWFGYRDAYKLLENYPRATFAVLDRAGHAAYVEQKALFEALTNEWLNRVEEYIALNSNKVTG